MGIVNFIKKLVRTEMLEISFQDQILCFTSSAIDKSYQGRIYKAYPFTHDNIVLSQESSSGNCVLRLPSNFEYASIFLSNPQVVKIKIWIMTDGEFDRIIFIGKAISAKLTMNTLEVTSSQTSAAVTLTVPAKQYSNNCQHSLYSQSDTEPACGVSRQTWKKTGKIVGKNGKTVTLLFDTNVESELLPLGAIILDRSKEARHIKEADGMQCVLNYEFSIVNIGDTFTFYPGCDKQRLGHCKNRYNNEINFYGHDKIPGQNPFKDPLK